MWLWLHSVRVATMQRGSDCEKIPHAQGQRSPSKMVGGVNMHLESNAIPTRDAQRVKQTIYAPGPRDPTETKTELCLTVCCGGAGRWWSAAGTGALGAADLGMA